MNLRQVINTLFKTFTINISNGVSAEKTQARLGAEFMNYGAQTISVTSSTVFTDPVFLSSSRANETLGLDFAIQNEKRRISMLIFHQVLSKVVQEVFQQMKACCKI